MKVLNASKDEIELELENLTIAEILRIYLNQDSSVSFAAWKRLHPTERPILKVKTKGKTVKKALNDAIESLEKDLDKTLEEFKKLK